MTVYTAAQETPTEVGTAGGARLPQGAERGGGRAHRAGRENFAAIGCARCHTPEMPLENTRFEEPTLRGNGTTTMPLAALDTDYDPKRPFAFDLLTDAKAPRLEARAGGGAVVRLYGDLKRHAMGRVLADPAAPLNRSGPIPTTLKYNDAAVTIPADYFLTAELWGVGNTGPWLHDNRAGTLREAVLLHGEDEPRGRRRRSQRSAGVA